MMMKLATQLGRQFMVVGPKKLHHNHLYLRPTSIKPSAYPNSSSSRRLFATAPPGAGKIIKNEEIKFPKVRVVYKDPQTSENTHQILERKEALELARKLDLDLVLG
jgi:hypothetical protein